MRPPGSVVLVVTAAAALLLGGCGGDGSSDEPESKSSPGDTRTLITHAPQSPASPTSTSTTTASVPPGRVKVSTGLPPGFPVEDIPLLDAKILIGQPGEPGGPVAWSIVMLPKGDIAGVANRAGALLANAGFEAGQKTSVQNLEVRSYSNTVYEVGVTVANTPEGNTLTYVISKKS